MSPITIYRARKIRTLWRANPTATAVAVRDGKILAVGTPASLEQWGEATIDDRYADSVLVPGFVEAHSHGMAGAMWNFPYIGFQARTDPAGKVWSGCRTLEEVTDRLKEINDQFDDDPAAPDSQPLIAWGLDPLFLAGERLNRHHLDAVSDLRPIFVFHASGHLATANTALMQREGITAATPIEGIPLGDDGEPLGELQEPAAMALARHAFFAIVGSFSQPESMWNYAKIAKNCGVTTAADLGTVDPKDWPSWLEQSNDEQFPARVVLAVRGYSGDDRALAELTAAQRDKSTDRLRFGLVKMIMDGSIQGFTARVRYPHYLNGQNGLWLIPPNAMADALAAYHEAGLTVHVHTNGDEAVDVLLDAVEEVQRRHPRSDHRHTSQHCQLTTPAQCRRMAALGVSANLFTNHIWYWGDEHRRLTVGEDRAAAMNACRTALDTGVQLSFHSDAPVTPMGPLHTMWCAVNRVTASGYILGPNERITPAEALEAATLGAAFQLKLDHEIGSIEPGKSADFAVLAEDPLDVDPMDIRDIEVRGTVLAGVHHPVG